MTSRFDYVKYDDKAGYDQDAFKKAMIALELIIEEKIRSPRARALAITKLEECYMWIGKGIRDDQIGRNSGAELQENRGNS